MVVEIKSTKDYTEGQAISGILIYPWASHLLGELCWKWLWLLLAKQLYSKGSQCPSTVPQWYAHTLLEKQMEVANTEGHGKKSLCRGGLLKNWLWWCSKFGIRSRHLPSYRSFLTHTAVNVFAPCQEANVPLIKPVLSRWLEMCHLSDLTFYWSLSPSRKNIFIILFLSGT
jgi:hypothetical protein